MKKILVMFLSLLLCFSLTASTPAQTVDLSIEKNHISLSNNEPFTMTLEPEYAQLLYGAPDDVLKGSTLDLLDYFLKSDYMFQQIFSFASTPYVANLKKDYTCHDAFCEFIARKDCLAALENYASNILNNSQTEEKIKRGLALILKQSFFETVLKDLENNCSEFPYLQIFYNNNIIELTAIGDYVASIQTVDFNSVDPDETFFTAKVDPEYLEWMNNAPEEVLRGSTSELLEYFLHSRFLMQCIFSSSSTFDIVTIDFTPHEHSMNLFQEKTVLRLLKIMLKRFGSILKLMILIKKSLN